MDLLERSRSALAGRYEIQSEIGRGAAATVFLAHDSKHDRRVAVKILRPSVAEGVGPERFGREIAIEAKLAHPHILPLFDSGSVDDLLFYVMPFVEGESLRARLQRESPLPVGTALRIAGEVADALDFAHRHGVIHRDVKPANILLVEDHALLADFGIARVLEGSRASLTSGDSVLGTPVYMSPEQAGSGPAVDRRTDVYSLGCVVHEMLTGAPPFLGPTPMAIIYHHMSTQASSIDSLRAGVPAGVSEAVQTALEKDPCDRFDTAGEFRDAILDPTPGSGGIRPRVARWARHASRRDRALALLTALILLFVFTQLWTGTTEDPNRSVLVDAVRTSEMDDDEERLSRQAAIALNRLLGQWREVRAPEPVHLSGIAFDLGFRPDSRDGVDESLSLARSVAVGTLVTVAIEIRGEIAELVATRFDVGSGRQLGEPMVYAGDKGRVEQLVSPVAETLLALAGAPEEVLVGLSSRMTQASQALDEGILLLSEWQLGAAADRFTDALETDSTFALGHYHLALTRYWQAQADVFRANELSARYRADAANAMRLRAQLGYRDSLHVAAFEAFVMRDYPAARAAYATLIESDPTDASAWVLSGAVEHQDEWLEVTPLGDTVPRGNPNQAVRAFLRAVELGPERSVAYGHLLELYGSLHLKLTECSQRGFFLPGLDPAVVANPQVDQFGFRCLAANDSLEWVRPERGDIDPERATATTETFVARAKAQLDRWVAYAPASPRPHRELASWSLTSRVRVAEGGPGDPIALSEDALHHWGRALSLDREWTVNDFVHLGAIVLATGDRSGAVALTDIALRLAEGRQMPLSAVSHAAINPYLAVGRPAEAVALTRTRDTEFYTAGSRVRYWGEDEWLELAALGAMGITGAPLAELYGGMEAAWDRQGYTEALRREVRFDATSFIGAGLVHDPAFRAIWFDGLPELPTLWRALGSDDPTARTGWLATVQAEPGALTIIDAYVLGVVFRAAGRESEALAAFRRVRDWVLPIDTFHPGWGLKHLVLLQMGRSLEALDQPGAYEAYESFLSDWGDTSPGLAALRAEAQNALVRLRSELEDA